MTRAELIKELKEMRTDPWTDNRQMEALSMGIKALGQEPNCPYYVIDDDGHGLCTNHRYIPTMYYPQVEGITPTVVKAEQEPSGDLISRQAVLDLFQDNVSTLHNYARVWEAVEEMPSVTPTQNCVENALGALDCISRQAVIDIVNNPLNIRLDEIIKKLPSVNPQEPKTGHWKRRIVDGGYNADWKCSECGYKVYTDFVNYNFCPMCGAKMVEPKEGEDKG